jgi:hypothetical protein
MLLIAGAQVPEIPFIELVGNSLIVFPIQNGPTCVNDGRMGRLIEIVIVCVVAQSPAVGVKVYVVVEVLLITGDQVPVIPFIELVGSGGIVAPLQ